MPTKPGKQIFGITAVAIALLLNVNFSYGLTAKETAQWKKDIDIYAEKTSGFYIDPFHSPPEKCFYNRINNLKKSLPKKSEEEVLIELMRLTHSISDGHTSFPLWGRELNNLLFSVKIFNGDAYIVKTTAHYKSLLGAK